MKNIFILTFIAFCLFNYSCSSSDDDNFTESNPAEEYEKRITKRVYEYSNGNITEETFSYDPTTKFVSQKISGNTINKYTYNSNNQVTEEIFLNNNLIRIKKYKYDNNQLKTETFDQNNNLESFTILKINNNKDQEIEGYDNGNNLLWKTTYRYENNGLTQIAINSDNSTNTTKYLNKTEKNYISPYAYLVHNNMPLYSEISYSDSPESNTFYEYDFNEDNYSSIIYYYDQNRNLKFKLKNIYQ